MREKRKEEYRGDKDTPGKNQNMHEPKKKKRKKETNLTSAINYINLITPKEHTTPHSPTCTLN